MCNVLLFTCIHKKLVSKVKHMLTYSLCGHNQTKCLLEYVSMSPRGEPYRYAYTLHLILLWVLSRPEWTTTSQKMPIEFHIPPLHESCFWLGLRFLNFSFCLYQITTLRILYWMVKFWNLNYVWATRICLNCH